MCRPPNIPTPTSSSLASIASSCRQMVPGRHIVRRGHTGTTAVAWALGHSGGGWREGGRNYTR
eukprot:2393811-Pyramimonas_sp.AAC.1